MEGKKVMIFEDDDFLRSLVVTKLQKESLLVATNVDGANALAGVKAEKPDIILLDLMLPAASGFDILKELRNDAETKDIKVIIFSNLGDEEDITKGNELGATDYLVKSNFTLDELVEKLKVSLGV
jgi:DNA-binding response OmpR family regulator